MAGLIPRYFIDDILARTDIVELIDGYVPLKKAGKNYQACCPFHNEKSPSFSVSADKQFYHCFGCGMSGNAITFLMEYDKLEFVEAIEDLAQKHHMEVPTEDGKILAKPQYSKAVIQSDFELMEQVSRFFRHQLKHHANSKTVIDYVKNRGLSGEVVKQFGIGYSPSEWDGALKMFGTNDTLRQQLLDLKVTTANDKGRQFDFFRDRLMFPIRNRRGKVIGFGGRIFGEGQPKYLNSPETRIFHKGFELYGLYEAKQFDDKITQVVVVEGYMDVVALAEKGIRYAVASLGTSTTPEHLQMLFRVVTKVIFCYDGDRAGIDAAWRALENSLAHLKDGIELTFTFLPAGEDPDTLVQKEGKDAFEVRLGQAKSFSQFFFEHLLQTIDSTTDSGKTALVAAAKSLIEKIPSEFFRDIILDKLAMIVGRERSQLERYFTALPKTAPAQGNKMKLTPMRRAIGLLVQHPNLANEIPLNSAYENIDMPGFGLLFNIQKAIIQMVNATTAQVIETYRDTKEGAYISRLASWDHMVNDELLVDEFKTTIRFVEDKYLNQRAEQLLLKAKTSTMTAVERKEYQTLVVALDKRKNN
ncbi:MAG: DNA primase [Alteromonadaceae bacterium]